MSGRDWEALIDAIAAWGSQTFPQETTEGRLHHLRREVGELAADPASGEEMADVFLILARHSRVMGVDLFQEVEAKFTVNKRRQWGQPDADGVVEHIDEPHPGARPADLEYPPGGLVGGFEWMHTVGFGRLDVEPCPRCGRAECPGDAGPSLDIEPEALP